MAGATAAPKKQQQDITPIPTEWPAMQLFVGVSDNDGAAVGFDGGPERGGSGAWARGDVRPWTSEFAVPLALRDPKDGLIVRGYLEPVLDMSNDGKTVLASGKFFATRNPKSGEWEAAAPTAKAMQRAQRGAGSVAKAFQPVAVQNAVRTRQDAMAAAGIPIDTVRASDRVVG